MEYQSVELDKLFAALAKAQGSFTPVAPDEKVDFVTQSSRKVKYDYASFKAIFNMARKPLADNGLAVTSRILGSKMVVWLTHESGQWLASECDINQGGDIKVFGGDMSYLRRYQYAAIIGAVIGGEDNENVAGEREVKQAKPAPDTNPLPPAHWSASEKIQLKLEGNVAKLGATMEDFFRIHQVKDWSEFANYEGEAADAWAYFKEVYQKVTII